MSRPTLTISPLAPHWLTFSAQGDPERLRKILGGDAYSTGIPSTAFACDGYWIHESGAHLHYDFKGRRVILDAAGDNATNWADHWFKTAVHVQGRITRLDLAREIGPPELARKRMISMRRAWFSNQVETKIRTFEESRSYAEGSGFTWYFGGRCSELRLRVYDRRGPLRLEFQWRPDDREALLAELLSKDLGACWSMFTSKLLFSFKWYKRAMGTSPQLAWTTTPQPSPWEKVAAELRQQWGFTLWALRQLGVETKDLERDPATMKNKTRGQVWAWACAAGERGKTLRAQLEALH